MAKTKEGLVKDKVRLILKSYGDLVYYFMPIGGPFSRIGVPDIVGCIKGKFIGIETKAGKGKPTALQEKNLINIMNTGGVAVLVNEKGIDALRMLLDAGLPDEGMFLDLIKEK